MSAESFKRKLTAILSADVKGYSRLMGEDEDATIRTLSTYRELMSTLIQKHRGRVVDSPGDNLLAEFLSVVDAVRCAVEIQEELRVRNDELPENRRMEVRIGINLGDVVEEGERIYGDGVNIAARVEGLAEGGGICISGTVYDSIKNKLSLGYESMGEHTVKNIKEPVRVYRMRIGPEAAGKVIGEKEPKRRRWGWKAAAAVPVLILLVGGLVWNFCWRAPKIEPASKEKMAFPLPDKPSIAVLPFANMSGDPKEDYLSDGLTEQIITSLSKFQRLFVIARNSTFVYKGKPVKIQKVAEDLAVRYVLEGSVQKSADRVRITAQLIDAITGHHVWSEHYDRELTDIFALQDEITMKITLAMKIELTEGEQARRWTKGGTKNLKASELNYQGIDFLRRGTKQDNDTARHLFEEAIALDRNYAWPYVNLGLTHYWDARAGWSETPAKSLQTAFDLAQKALAMEESLDLGHSLLGSVYNMQRQYDKALAEAERAVALNPNGAEAYYFLAGIAGCAGRWEESVSYIKKSIRLNPSPMVSYYGVLGRAHFMTGHYDEAIVELKKALQMSPDYPGAHIYLAGCYSSMGRDAEATAAAKEVLRMYPKFTIESYAKTLPYKEKADLERELAALRKAGLPDKPPLPLPDKPSIAVLPFTNLSEDKSQDYFSDGLTEDIITALSKIPNLFVIARNSSFVYKGKPVNVPQVSRELGVKYVLEGSVRRSGNQLRITAQLIDATTGNHFWAERYDREMKDIFAVQDEVTIKILASILGKTVMEEEYARVNAKRASNVEAYLKAGEANALTLRFNKDDIALARKKFEEAIALDPQWANAYSGLSYTYYFDSRFVQNPGESLKRAYEYAQKAISLDETQVYALNTLRLVYQSQRRYEEAIAAAEQAVKVAPGLADACAMLGQSLLFNGRNKEALVYFEKALRMNPFPETWYFMEIGNAHLISRNYEEAVSTYKKALSISPKNSFARGGLIVTYVEMGRMEEARVEAEEMIKIDPKFTTKGWEKRATWKDPKVIERFVEAWRKAGLERDVSTN